MDHNTRIAEAIIELQSQDRPKYAETARKYNIDKSTLWRRFKGKTASNHDANSYSRQKLTSAQEEILIGHVNKLTDRGIPPTLRSASASDTMTIISGRLLIIPGISKLLQSSKTAFIVISRVYCRQYSVKCRKVAISDRIQLAPRKDRKVQHQSSNVYNFDEKGFQIGLSRSTKRVVPREALRRGKLVGASQDGNREFITLIAAICADYSYLPPALIYKGVKDFQDTWLEDFDHSSEVAFFASTENGWSCDALGLHWLQRIFDCHTKQSHINLKFIDYADRNRILIAVLPSHSTHRLQPLDVGLFSALSTYYAQGSDQLMSIGWGLIRLTKRNFWPLFRDAWNQAFTAKNIEAGWRATGIHPLDPGKVLSKISHSSDVTPPQTASEERAMKTPGSLRAIRRITRRLRKEGPMDSRVTALSRASEKLATQYELVQHENRDLQEALKLAHKKGKRRKALGLFNPEESGGQPVFFSPAKVELARRRQTDKAQADEQRKQAIEDRRLQVAISREEKARESAEKKNSGLQCVRPCESSREAKRAEKREAAAKLKAERSAREAERQAIREVKFEVAATSKPAVRKRGRWKRVCATGIQPRNNSEEERVKIGSEASVARDHSPGVYLPFDGSAGKYGGRFLSLSGLIFALACRSGNLYVRRGNFSLHRVEGDAVGGAPGHKELPMHRIPVSSAKRMGETGDPWGRPHWRGELGVVVSWYLTRAERPSSEMRNRTIDTVVTQIVQGNVPYVRKYLGTHSDAKIFLHGVDSWDGLLSEASDDEDEKTSLREAAVEISGTTALHMAACEQYPKTVDLLLSKGADANAADINGRTPLMEAALDPIEARGRQVLACIERDRLMLPVDFARPLRRKHSGSSSAEYMEKEERKCNTRRNQKPTAVVIAGVYAVPYEVQVITPYDIFIQIVSYLSPLSKDSLLKTQNHREVPSRIKESASIWAHLFKDEAWLQEVVDITYGHINKQPVPCLIGKDLIKQTLLHSLKPHTFDKANSEVHLEGSGITLHIYDAIRSSESLSIQDPARLLRREGRGVSTYAIYYDNQSVLEKIGPRLIQGIEGVTWKSKKAVRERFAIVLRHPIPREPD
ncbi:DDE superfamily endonuclease [Hirsutella rhossiliensis]